MNEWRKRMCGMNVDQFRWIEAVRIIQKHLESIPGNCLLQSAYNALLAPLEWAKQNVSAGRREK